MIELTGIFVGVMMGLLGCVAIPLFCYIKQVEDETVCEGCEKGDSCIARKPAPIVESNMLSEWMLITFLRVRKTCQYVTPVKHARAKYILYIIFNTVLVSVLFWSKGFNTVGLVSCVAASAMLSLSVVDWNTQYIPLEMNGIIFLCGLIQLFADLSNWLEYVIGLIAVSGFLYIADRIGTCIYNASHSDDSTIDNVIGDGDIKLMAATGLLLGWKLNILALIIGCMAGSVIHVILMMIKKGERRLALGPYLSLGVYITMICGEQLVSWYLSMVGIVPIN